MKTIAYVRNDFSSKFGVPRQPGLVPEVVSTIVFEPEYRVAEALRGLEEYSHLWLLWLFSETRREGWSPTVRPPRLGGNTRVGVFATRSPFRPNPIGLSCVKLEGVEWEGADAPALLVSGADLVDGTPIYDVKPYIPYADAYPEAAQGFTSTNQDYELEVEFPQRLLEQIPAALRPGLIGALAQDPRPS